MLRMVLSQEEWGAAWMATDIESTEGMRSTDLATLTGVLRVCDLELTLLDGGNPRVALESRVHDGALFLSARTGFRFRGRFMLPLDWCMVGFVQSTDPAKSWCHGTPLSSGLALTVLAEGISEFVLAENSHVLLVLMPVRRLQRRFTELSLRDGLPPSRALSLFRTEGGGWGERLRMHCEGLARRVVDGRLLDDEVEALLEQHIQAALAASTRERPACPRAHHSHYLIVQRAEAFMRQHMRRDIYLQELCTAAGVSERALRYAFEHMLGLSPTRYLSMLRLCAACRSLSMADGARRTVKAIALACGLWDLSRFADNYRRVFGELPSETLMRHPPHDEGASLN